VSTSTADAATLVSFSQPVSHLISVPSLNPDVDGSHDVSISCQKRQFFHAQ